MHLGPYIIILGMLAESEIRLGAMRRLVLHNAVFIVPMIAITAAVYLVLSWIAERFLQPEHFVKLHAAIDAA